MRSRASESALNTLTGAGSRMCAHTTTTAQSSIALIIPMDRTGLCSIAGVELCARSIAVADYLRRRLLSKGRASASGEQYEA